MIQNSTYINESALVKTDICIIGAGVAGITIAREFINKNVDVVLLESGGFESTEETRGLLDGKNVGLRYDFENSRGRGFGGTSLMWDADLGEGKIGVRLRELDAIDFEQRDWVPNSGWPFGKNHLNPYYEKAHKVFQLGPYTSDPEDWEDPVSTPKLPFRSNNVKTTIFRFARNSVFSNDYRKEIEASKNVHAYLNATVLKINTTENAAKVKSVVVVSPNGKRFKVQAKYFILATGGLEVPRMLLNTDDVVKTGLGNQYDLVGRYYMEHPHLWTGSYFPSNRNIYKQAGLYKIHTRNGISVMGKLMLNESVQRREKLLNFTTSIHPDPLLGVYQAGQSFRALMGSGGRKSSKELLKHSKFVLNNLNLSSSEIMRKVARSTREEWYDSNIKAFGFKLNIMAEQEPDPESRLTLDRERDRLGQRKLALNWKVNSNDMRSIRRAQEILDEEMRKSGLGTVHVELSDSDTVPSDIHGGFHHMGTTRMHRNPKKGVVDENCRLHSTQNLFIAGSSVFPTVGFANPTLTIVAMSLRLAGHLNDKVNKRKRSLEFS